MNGRKAFVSKQMKANKSIIASRNEMSLLVPLAL